MSSRLSDSIYRSLLVGCPWWIGLALILLAACVPVAGVQHRPSETATAFPLERAPDFRLPALAGDEVALHDFQGRWVLINFWATWCTPCREEMPTLQRLADIRADHLTVLGINMREEMAALQPFLDELDITFPILLQPDNDTLLAYGVRGLPLTFLVDPEGHLVWRQIGPLQSAEIEALLPPHDNGNVTDLQNRIVGRRR